jgi:hypothetical protein
VLGVDRRDNAAQPSFNVAEQGMESSRRTDRHRYHRSWIIGVCFRSRRGRLEAAITGGPVGQQMEPACDMGLEAPSCPKANRLLLRSPFLERFRNWLFSREATLAAL